MPAWDGYCVHTTGSDWIGPAASVIHFNDNHFYGVLMNSYVEHEVDVLRSLHNADVCFKRSGKPYLRVSSYATVNRCVVGRCWCGFRYPDRVKYFTPGSWRFTAASAGFRIRVLNLLRFPIDDNIDALLTKIG